MSERRFRVTIAWETPPEAMHHELGRYSVTGGNATYVVVTPIADDTCESIAVGALRTFRVRREDCTQLDVTELRDEGPYR